MIWILNSIVTAVKNSKGSEVEDLNSIASSLMAASSKSDAQLNRTKINASFFVIETAQNPRITLAKFDEALLEVIFKRPSGPLLNSTEDFIEVRMTRLTMPEAQEHDPTIVQHVSDRPSLDWDRLRDCNDDYDCILFDPNQEFIPDLDRAN